MANLAQSVCPAIAAVAHDAAHCLGALLQRIQGDLVCIGKAGFLTANSANSDTLIDIVRAIFDDAVFNHSGFVIAGLKNKGQRNRGGVLLVGPVPGIGLDDSSYSPRVTAQ